RPECARGRGDRRSCGPRGAWRLARGAPPAPRGVRSAGAVEVGDAHRLDRFGELDAEHAAEEVQLDLERSRDVGRLAETVPLAGKRDVRTWDTRLAQRVVHHRRLV